MIPSEVMQKPQLSRAAYTLLELILALALSVIVMLGISMAIQLYLVALTKQQAFIERKLVAKGVREMIGNDLRGAIQYKAEDYSDLENLVQSQLMKVNQAASALSGEESAPEEQAADPVIDEENVAFRPTLIGTENAILIDVSRLPRLDEYNPLVANLESSAQSPSDVKSVAYFVSLSETQDNSQVQFANKVAPGGLYRRAIDRAVANYSGDTSLLQSADDYCRLVASEIAQIQFRYFDGEDWQLQWDSVENGGFPTAIEVTIVIDPQRSVAGQNYSYAGFDNQNMESQTFVVHLPAAEVQATGK